MDINEINEGFVIDSDQKSEWAIKKIKEAQAEHDRLMELVKAEREELDRKAEEINKRLDSETGYLKGLLYKYFETVEHKQTKTQESYKLLSGSLVFKKPSVKIVQPDDEELVKYLESSQPELIKTVKKPMWGEWKKNLTISDDGQVTDMATGEVLYFVKTEEEPGRFEVK